MARELRPALWNRVCCSLAVHLPACMACGRMTWPQGCPALGPVAGVSWHLVPVGDVKCSCLQLCVQAPLVIFEPSFFGVYGHLAVNGAGEFAGRGFHTAFVCGWEACHEVSGVEQLGEACGRSLESCGLGGLSGIFVVGWSVVAYEVKGSWCECG